MTKQAVRLTLLTIALAAVAATAWIGWMTQRQLAENGRAARQFAISGGQALTAIADLRAAQQSYVAADQGDAFWSGRVAAIARDLNDRVASLKSSSTSPETAAALDEAATEFQNFNQVDKRARELTLSRRLTAASDLIYSDGFDQTKKAADAIEHAISAELAARDGSSRVIGKQAAASAGGAVGLLIFVAIVLTPLPRRGSTQPAVSGTPPVAAPQPLDPPSVDLSIAPPALPAPSAAPSIDLGGIAALCADLARVANTSALPGLLSRASAILDAAGIVVWVADPDGRELFPTLVHGYPPHIANRLGTLVRDSENVTAAAFRTGLLQVVKATATSNGAVAAPLVAASGTVGVMAVELRNRGEQKDARRAAVAIVAAQVATLVGPPSHRAARTEAAG